MLFQYETNRLILKILHPDDAALVLDFYERDQELFEKYETARIPEFYTLKHQHRLLQYEYSAAMKLSTVRFYVFLKEQPDQIVGTVCLHNIIRTFYHTCEIGYKFSSHIHGHGYAFEAIDCCIQIAFCELELHRITALVCHDNERSKHLLNCLGFRLEGICRDYLLLQGQWQDHFLYSLLCTDSRINYVPTEAIQEPYV